MLQTFCNLSQVKRFKTYLLLHKLATKNLQQGFTIIESLMAIIVVTILLVGITPPIFLVVGTRVQNQRAEQAMQLAQLEIDRVRVLMERGDFEKTSYHHCKQQPGQRWWRLLKISLLLLNVIMLIFH